MNKLEKEIIPLYYERNGRPYSKGWVNRMRASIALGAHFNTHRVIKEYADKAWNIERQPRWCVRENLD